WTARAAASTETYFALVLGGMQKRVTNTARSTVMESSYLDTKARGWMRIGTGNCDFCAMLIARGAVYTEQTVDFSTPDWCGCGAAAAWNPAQVKTSLRPYVESAKRRKEKTRASDNARAREWIAHNLQNTTTVGADPPRWRVPLAQEAAR